MYDRKVLVERLRTLLEALERIPRRFSGISEPADFYGSDEGITSTSAVKKYRSGSKRFDSIVFPENGCKAAVGSFPNRNLRKSVCPI